MYFGSLAGPQLYIYSGAYPGTYVSAREWMGPPTCPESGSALQTV